MGTQALAFWKGPADPGIKYPPPKHTQQKKAHHCGVSMDGLHGCVFVCAYHDAHVWTEHNFQEVSISTLGS